MERRTKERKGKRKRKRAFFKTAYSYLPLVCVCEKKREEMQGLERGEEIGWVRETPIRENNKTTPSSTPFYSSSLL